MDKVPNTETNNIVNEFFYPQYNGKCISDIPGTLLNLFGIKNDKSSLSMKIEKRINKKISKIVLFVLDGFGYNQFKNYNRDREFFNILAKNAEVVPITSVFPSQTTNALTSLNTGLTPQEHGLFEYYIYLKEFDKIINTLRFQPIRSKNKFELIEQGIDPSFIFKKKTIQSKLREEGIKTYTHIQTSYAYTPYTRCLFGDSNILPSLRTSDTVVKFRKNLEKVNGPAYFFVHISSLDLISHEYGPNSYEYGVELSTLSYLLNKELIKKINRKIARETLMLFVADHGGITTIPEKTTYLDQYPKIINNLEVGKEGNRILPTGSSRDVFLHVKKNKITETRELLSRIIGDKAKITYTSDEINRCLFGKGDPEDTFLDRVGNLLIEDKEKKKSLAIAAILHDIGHGPFSHALEKKIKSDRTHGQISKEIIESPDHKISEILNDEGIKPTEISEILTAGAVKPKYLHRLISSQLDIDRFDYLLRDSLMSGNPHGGFDIERIIQTLRINDEDEIYVKKGGWFSVEHYLNCRYQMQKQVYYHHSTLAAEELIKKIIDRCRFLFEKSKIKIDKRYAPLMKDDMNLSEFLEITDFDILNIIKLHLSIYCAH